MTRFSRIFSNNLVLLCELMDVWIVGLFSLFIEFYLNFKILNDFHICGFSIVLKNDSAVGCNPSCYFFLV